MSPTTIHPRAARRGFTIVEMLVVVAIIVVLLSLLVVAVSLGSRSAQRANTAFLMASVNKALATFRNDFGYLPPVLGERLAAGGPVAGGERTAVNPPDPGTASFDTDLQNWYSETTLAEFLLGAGDRTEDGYGVVGDVSDAATQFPNSPGVKEVPTLGIRDPGPDGVWGAWTNPRVFSNGSVAPANGSIGSRKLTPFQSSPPATSPSLQANNDLIPGKVYGPYLDLKEARLVGRVLADGTVTLPGDASYDATRPAVIVDYWGRPLRYYRRLHAPNDVRTVDRRANVGDFFALRPWTLNPGDDVLANLADQNPDVTSPLPNGGTTPGDNGTSRRLVGADFALLSEGPDRRWARLIRADPDEFNKDNIVEVGE